MKSLLPDHVFNLKEIALTDDVIVTEWSEKIPTSAENKVRKIRKYLQKEPKRAISAILELKKKYKEVPILNNYLCSCYLAIRDLDKAEKIAQKNYTLFPEYLFAKTNYAQFLLEKGETHKIEKIFDKKYDLQSLYPSRTTFHVSEFISFMGIWAIYFYKIGENDLAKCYYKAMRNVDNKHILTQNLKQLIYPPFIIRVLKKIFGKEKLNKKNGIGEI